MDDQDGAEPLDALVLEQLRDTVGGDDGFFEELLRTYLTDGTEQLATMTRALGAHDAETLERAAHSLKSNSAGLGAARLGTLCADLEALARDGELDSAASGLARVEQEFQRVMGALDRRLTGAGRPDAAGGTGATGATSGGER